MFCLYYYVTICSGYIQYYGLLIIIFIYFGFPDIPRTFELLNREDYETGGETLTGDFSQIKFTLIKTPHYRWESNWRPRGLLCWYTSTGVSDLNDCATYAGIGRYLTRRQKKLDNFDVCKETYYTAKLLNYYDIVTKGLLSIENNINEIVSNFTYLP